MLGSPHGRLLDFRFHGRAAHSGMAPEDGRSAVAAAARAIADFRLGRVDDETSANVGVIEGGTARNVVPEWCSFTAEVRSHDERKANDLVREMLETAAFAASLAECEVESEVRPSFPGYRFRRDDEPVRLAATALQAAGFEPSYALSGGGADANVFNARGLACVNLANGMAEIHTPDEHIAVADLEAMVEVTLALVEAPRQARRLLERRRRESDQSSRTRIASIAQSGPLRESTMDVRSAPAASRRSTACSGMSALARAHPVAEEPDRPPAARGSRPRARPRAIEPQASSSRPVVSGARPSHGRLVVAGLRGRATLSTGSWHSRAV